MQPVKIKVRSITNDVEPTISDWIEQLSQKAIKVFLASAYLTEDGIKKIERPIKSILKQKGEVSILTGGMGGVTTPNALRQLLTLKSQWTNLSVRFVNSRFHLKSFLFQSNTHLNAIIGSANLTGNGLTEDGEQSLLVSVPINHRSAREIMAPFVEFWGDEYVTMELTEDVIKEYSKTWKPRYNFEKSVRIKRKGKQSSPTPHKKVKYHYFYGPEYMTDRENRIIGRETGWTKRGYTWLGLYGRKHIAYGDYIVVDDRKTICTGRVYGVRYDIAEIDIVVAYRSRTTEVSPTDISKELRGQGYEFSLTKQRSKRTRISGYLFVCIEGAIKKINK